LAAGARAAIRRAPRAAPALDQSARDAAALAASRPTSTGSRRPNRSIALSSSVCRLRTATPLLETLALLCHYAAIGAAVYALPHSAARAAFLCSAMGVAGILHVQITISHFPMATYNVRHRVTARRQRAT
jgi:hypothetical protein